jgi:parallel beta-helix repeat protein
MPFRPTVIASIAAVSALAATVATSPAGASTGRTSGPLTAPAAPTAAPCTGVPVPTAADLPAVVAVHGPATTFCLGTGTYRITAAIAPKASDSIVGQPGTVISGAKVVTGWVRTAAAWTASGYLPAAYTDPGYNPCQVTTTNLCKLDEWLFRDNVELRRVAGVAAVVPRTFYTDYAANRIYLGDDPTGHLLEVSRTRTAIASTSPGVTLRGLRVEKFATRNQQGAIVANAGRWTVVNCDVRFNHGAGIYDYGSDLHVTGSRIHHNGTLGIGVYHATGVLVDGNELDHNNTDGSRINDGENGGYKSSRTTDTIRANTVHDNMGMGLWFDGEDQDSLIETNRIVGNAASGIRFEISHRAIIRNNTLTNNGRNRQQGDGSLYYGASIDVDNSNGAQVYGNTVKGGDNGIGLAMQSRGSGSQGLYAVTDADVHDNDVTMAGGVTGMVQSVGTAAYFTDRGNRFTGNRYALDSFASPRFAWRDRTGDVNYWRGVGQDGSGSFVIAG